MRHAANNKKRSSKNNFSTDMDNFSARRIHTDSTLAYRHARQRGFLSGEDFLSALETETWVDEMPVKATFRRGAR